MQCAYIITGNAFHCILLHSVVYLVISLAFSRHSEPFIYFTTISSDKAPEQSTFQFHNSTLPQYICSILFRKCIGYIIAWPNKMCKTAACTRSISIKISSALFLFTACNTSIITRPEAKKVKFFNETLNACKILTTQKNHQVQMQT